MPTPAPPAARSRTTTRPRAGSTTSRLAAERVAVAAGAKGDVTLTARCESHLYGGTDLDDTIARLVAYRDAGADVVYAPGLTDLGQIAAVVEAVGMPVNVLGLPTGPTMAELASVGVRRVSVGSLLASAAYAALVAGWTRAARRGHLHVRRRPRPAGPPRAGVRLRLRGSDRPRT